MIAERKYEEGKRKLRKRREYREWPRRILEFTLSCLHYHKKKRKLQRNTKYRNKQKLNMFTIGKRPP